MKGYSAWNQTPYARLFETQKKSLPYVSLLAPHENGFTLEWFDFGSLGAHTLSVCRRGTDERREYPLPKSRLTVDGLVGGVDYELCVTRADGTGSSPKRLVRTGFVHGAAVNYLHPEDDAYASSGNYLGSPSVLRLPSGKLIVCMDVHGNAGENIAILFHSLDGGKSWSYLTELSPCQWPKLFYHRGKLYCIACAAVLGDIIVGCSTDEGKSWSAPVHIVHGVRGDFGGHKCPAPVIRHNGRLYTTFEYGSWGKWRYCHSLLSIDENADPMLAENWSFTTPTELLPSYPGMPRAEKVTAVEGNALPMPDGGVGVMLRLDPKEPSEPYFNKAALVREDSSDSEAPLVFDQIVDLPCGIRHKFCIQREPTGLGYIALCNENTADYGGRGVLCVAISQDLISWQTVHRIVDVREDERCGKDDAYSYPDFDFDGEDLVIVARTAANGQKNSHDNNYVTFHRLGNYKRFFKA